MIRVEGILDENDVANAVYFGDQRRDLAAKLGANLISVQEMRTHAQAFDGDLHVRSTAQRVMVSALLHSHAAEMQKQKASAPLRLWVN